MESNIAIIIGTALGAYSLFSMYKCFQSNSWEKTKGTVADTDIVSTRGARNTEETETIFYEYVVNGKKYRGKKVKMGIEMRFTSDNYSSARDRLSMYRIGQSVNVYYNPKNPKEACLIPGGTFGNIAGLVIAALLIGFGLKG